MSANSVAHKEILESCKSGSLSRLRDVYNSNTKGNLNIDFVDEKGRSGFIYATIGKFREMLVFLIEQQCDVNLKDVEGKNALHHAADADNKQMIIFLLMNGVDAMAVDAAGKVPGADRGATRLFIEDVIESNDSSKMKDLLLADFSLKWSRSLKTSLGILIMMQSSK